MKYLTLIRHAKSSWEKTGAADHDRPLNDRGRLAAPAVGTFLYRTYLGGGEGAPLLPQPDRLVSSTALRALGTAQLMREVMGLPPEVLLLTSKLYLAEAGQILDIVHGLDERWQHVMMFGHNPGMHDFAERILARAHVPKMPTCTAVLLGLPHEYWGLADWGEAQLIGYVTPRTLERRFPDLYSGISRPDGGD
ncbi:MAG: histidine phosphatase family protein [Prosthecobacter sp.]|nr:histidine phosphatase family protein [Prosthecobacter sp.]